MPILNTALNGSICGGKASRLSAVVPGRLILPILNTALNGSICGGKASRLSAVVPDRLILPILNTAWGFGKNFTGRHTQARNEGACAVIRVTRVDFEYRIDSVQES